MDAGDASFPGGVSAVLSDDDFGAGGRLGLNPAPVFIGIALHAGRAAELRVLQRHRLAGDALTERHLVGDAINDDVGFRLAGGRLVKDSFQLDVTVLQVTVAAKDSLGVFSDRTGKCTASGSTLANGLFLTAQSGGLERNALEAIGKLEALAELDAKLSALGNCLALVLDVNVDGGVHGELVSEVATSLNVGNGDSAIGSSTVGCSGVGDSSLSGGIDSVGALGCGHRSGRPGRGEHERREDAHHLSTSRVDRDIHPSPLCRLPLFRAAIGMYLSDPKAA